MGAADEKYDEVCRTCLSGDGLSPIFVRPEHWDRYTVVLYLVTGLRIEKQDGLPQAICSKCVSAVNRAIMFRNLCHRSEMTLVQNGRRRNRVRLLREVQCDKIPVKLEYAEEECENSGGEREDELHIEHSLEVIHNHCDQRGEQDYLRTNDNENELKADGKTAKNVETKVDRKESYKKLVEGISVGAGPFACTICKKRLKSWSSFRTHAKIHLGFDFLCEHCGMRFVAVTMLQRHLMSRHGAERTYRCASCDHRATDSERLKIHERKAHTGERPYVCDTCGAGFLTRRHLVHHLAVHTTRRTVQCPSCPSKFKSTQHLASHTSKVHRRRALICSRGDTRGKLDYPPRHVMRAHSDHVPPTPIDSNTRIRGKSYIRI